jgi:hypothetical protein
VRIEQPAIARQVRHDIVRAEAGVWIQEHGWRW